MKAHVVFPTCVGMNRISGFDPGFMLRIPHMRGDEPALGMSRAKVDEYSPHAWG